MPKKQPKKSQTIGFNSVESCPNCNKCLCHINKEECRSKISRRHEFMNYCEFTDKALLEELIIRIKKGCIEIKKKNQNFIFEEECRWDLSRGMKKNKKGEIVEDKKFAGNYSISLKELIDIQNSYRKMEDGGKLCNTCLERELMPNDKIFCQPCWDRETKSRTLRSKKVKINNNEPAKVS